MAAGAGIRGLQWAWRLVDQNVATWDGGIPQGMRNAPRTRSKSASEMVLEDRR